MPTATATEETVKSLHQLHASLLACWNRRDADGFAALFMQEGNVVGFDGTPVDGAHAIREHLHQIFSNHRPAAFVALVREVRAIGPGAALLRAVAGMVPPGQSRVKPEVNAIQSLVAQQEGGHWRIQLFQNTPAAFHERPDAAAGLTAELQEELERGRQK
jgi:uncharacterized protein (TIGR02246 family)